MLRYAVLHHTQGEPSDHFDFLVEIAVNQGDLLTFRLPNWPLSQPVEVKRLKNHRRICLTYEGEVSNSRGLVSRVAEGTATFEDRSGALHFALSSGRSITFYPDRDDIWIARE